MIGLGGSSVSAEAVYASLVSRIQGAVATITWRSGETTHLWTVIASSDEDVAGRIYELEAFLQEEFAEEFDFYVYAGGVEDRREFKAGLVRYTFLPEPEGI
ncbi:MAG TPA: hypothetical protein VKM93_23075 [Terriglobia bacterium]|nr:hypothetical protein [Terriglobia bacterium]